MRIDVDPNHLSPSQPQIPYCQISTEEKTLLAIAIIILSMLSSATWIVAFYNRPNELPVIRKFTKILYFIYRKI